MDSSRSTLARPNTLFDPAADYDPRRDLPGMGLPHWLDHRIQGRIALPRTMRHLAAQAAAAHFDAAKLQEFSGDSVEDLVFPDWFARRDALLPCEALRDRGFERAGSGIDDPALKDRYDHSDRMYATADVDMHVDDMHGVSFILVLHNDGLTFVHQHHDQVTSHQPEAGDWFLFDDRLPHRVDSTDVTTALLIWSVPLQPLGFSPTSSRS